MTSIALFLWGFFSKMVNLHHQLRKKCWRVYYELMKIIFSELVCSYNTYVSQETPISGGLKRLKMAARVNNLKLTLWYAKYFLWLYFSVFEVPGRIF